MPGPSCRPRLPGEGAAGGAAPPALLPGRGLARPGGATCPRGPAVPVGRRSARPRRAVAGAAARPPSVRAPRRAAPGDAVRAARQRGRPGAVRAGGGRGQHGGEVPRLRPGGRRQGLQLQEGECGRVRGALPVRSRAERRESRGQHLSREPGGAQRARSAPSGSDLRAPERLRGLPVGARRSLELAQLGCPGARHPLSRAGRSGSPSRGVKGKPQPPTPAGPP